MKHFSNNMVWLFYLESAWGYCMCNDPSAKMGNVFFCFAEWLSLTTAFSCLQRGRKYKSSKCSVFSASGGQPLHVLPEEAMWKKMSVSSYSLLQLLPTSQTGQYINSIPSVGIGWLFQASPFGWLTVPRRHGGMLPCTRPNKQSRIWLEILQVPNFSQSSSQVVKEVLVQFWKATLGKFPNLWLCQGVCHGQMQNLLGVEWRKGGSNIQEKC